jgi:hypothetical protein
MLSVAKHLVFFEILRSLRSLRMTGAGILASGSSGSRIRGEFRQVNMKRPTSLSSPHPTPLGPQPLNTMRLFLITDHYFLITGCWLLITGH